jgi:hypothetical protein
MRIGPANLEADVRWLAVSETEMVVVLIVFASGRALRP